MMFFRTIGVLFFIGIMGLGCSHLSQPTSNISDQYTVYLTGRVLDKDGKPMANAVAKLAGRNLYDTTGADGYYYIIETRTNRQAKTASAEDSLQIIKESQIITSLEIQKWIDTLPDVFIVQRDISGSLSSSPAAGSRITATITIDTLPDSPRKITELGYIPATNNYSGYLYFVFTTKMLSYNVIVSVYSANNVLTGRSVTVTFPSNAGDISIPAFNPNNAILAVNAGEDTTVSIKDSVRLKATVYNLFGRHIAKWEWNIGNSGFRQTSSGDTIIIAPADSNPEYLCVVRVTDDDGNTALDTVKILVSQDIPVVYAGGDTVVSIKDTIRLHASANQIFGNIAKWEWNIGNSGFRQTSSGDTIIIAPADSNPEYLCVVRVTDDDGNTALDTMKILVSQDIPVAHAGNDSLVLVKSTVRLHGSVTQQFGKIIKWEWNVGNAGFVQTSTGDTSIIMPDSEFSAYTCILRVTDDDGNQAESIRYFSVLQPPEKAGMKIIPGGTFMFIGSSIDQPEHQVTITTFMIDSTEITQEKYIALMGINPAHFAGNIQLPVEMVTWFDAVLFCNARSKSQGLDTVYSYTSIVGNPGNGCTSLNGLIIDVTKKGYSLPTEAEWEYASRGGTETVFYWGDSINNNYCWNMNNSANISHIVAAKLPNAFGLYDMSGNLWEWGNTWLGRRYIDNIIINPTGPPTGSSRLVLGGNFECPLGLLSSAGWSDYLPNDRNAGVGFRCVRRH